MNLWHNSSHAAPARVFRHRAALVAAGCLAATALVAPVSAQRVPGTSSLTIHAAAAQAKRDSMTITLEPMARTEVKLEMNKGQRAEYRWKSDGNVIFNLHGEGPNAPGGKAHSYKRGESKGESGEIIALFDGVHGWSWRNTSDKAVKVTVTAWGQFQQLKKM